MKFIEILPGWKREASSATSFGFLTGAPARRAEELVVSAGKAEHALVSASILAPARAYKNADRAYSAGGIASAARREGYGLIHAHSRVPGLGCPVGLEDGGVPFVVTLLVRFGNRSPAVYKPYRLGFARHLVSESASKRQGRARRRLDGRHKEGPAGVRGKMEGQITLPGSALRGAPFSHPKGIDVPSALFSPQKLRRTLEWWETAL
jgi:hypothetical protein